MKMTVKNNANKTLKRCSVVHDWDDNVDRLDCNGLAPQATSHVQTITSGYTQYDWYNVDVEYGDGSTRQQLVTRFYCNSSYAQDAVQIVIKEDGTCDCVYYEGDTVATGCYDKG